METTIVLGGISKFLCGVSGIMAKKMETSIVLGVICIGVLGFGFGYIGNMGICYMRYRDHGKENGKCYLGFRI